MNAAIYLRVSTRKQDTGNQLGECMRLCEARGWRVRVYEETGSGVKARPVWEDVKRLAHEGKVQAVVIWSLDRVGRRMFEIIRDVTELARLGCKVASVREPWLDRDDGLLLSVFSWVAQHEHQRISDRTKAGLERAAKAGRFPGRPKGDQLPAKALWAAREMRKGYMSWGAIATQLKLEGLGEFTRWQVQRAVDAEGDDPALAGAGAPSGGGEGQNGAGTL